MTHWLPISDPSDVSVCRRNARQLAQVAGFSQARTEEIAIVVSEAATNVLRYAKRGRCLLQRMPGIGGPRLAVIVVDQGPGIDALDKMMRDGSSSEGSAGLGLGAMQRLSDQFDIYSNRDEGTVVACEFQLRPYRPTAMEVAGLLVTHPGETRCGDAWDMICVTPNATPDGRLDLILCDGLGHVRVTCKEITPRASAPFGDVRWDCCVLNACGAVVARFDLLTLVMKSWPPVPQHNVSEHKAAPHTAATPHRAQDPVQQPAE